MQNAQEICPLAPTLSMNLQQCRRERECETHEQIGEGAMKRNSINMILGLGMLTGVLLSACGGDKNSSPKPVTPQEQVAWTEEQKIEAIEFYSDSAILLNSAQQALYGECIFKVIESRVDYAQWVASDSDDGFLNDSEIATCINSSVERAKPESSTSAPLVPTSGDQAAIDETSETFDGAAYEKDLIARISGYYLASLNLKSSIEPIAAELDKDDRKFSIAASILKNRKTSPTKLLNLALSFTLIPGKKPLVETYDYENYETDIGNFGTYYEHLTKLHKEEWRALRLAIAYFKYKGNGKAEPRLSIIVAMGEYGFSNHLDFPYSLANDAEELFGYEIGIAAIKTAGILYQSMPSDADPTIKARFDAEHARYVALVDRYETVYKMKIEGQNLSSLSEDEKIWLLENDYLKEDLEIIRAVKKQLTDYQQQ